MSATDRKALGLALQSAFGLPGSLGEIFGFKARPMLEAGSRSSSQKLFLSPDTNPPKQPDPSAPPLSLMAARVLLVEDDLISASALLTILRRRGYEVQHASTFAQGLQLLANQPAFVILDLMLPDGNGSVILKEIRDRGLAARVVVTTAVSDPDWLTDVASLKPDVVMQKPIDLAGLLAMMQPIH